ncbi:MAG: hypothetical protein KatS3mg003_0277 [Candidatus Nitrosocaldaceae archaeon]|nr:MAG: hypothetical protein KatS3mg003_0277 [Candidatus Nitrosocaldaceae archaeon]
MIKQGGLIIGGLVIGMLLLIGMLIITSMQDNNNIYALLLLLWILITIAFGFIYMTAQGISINITPPIRII